MPALPQLEIILDDVTLTVQTAPGDYVRAERDGYGFVDGNLNSAAKAAVAFHALQRLKRKGEITEEVPDSFEDFLDSFDLPDMEVEEDEPGNS